MKSKFLYLLILILLISNHSYGQNNQQDSLDHHIKKLMEYFETPGLAISIVQNGNIQYARGFGTRTINKNEPVDDNTLFAIGSITKSFTALALGMLVDEGKINWDDKVIKYLPYFQLYDPYVTNSFTIRDLLIHRSGLKEVSGGTLFYHSDLNREDIIKRLKYLDQETEFRTKPAYQNIMYLVAAKIVEVVSGSLWDDFIREQIFKPLGMSNTVISQSERIKSKNISAPHIKNEKFQVIPIEQEKLDNIAPAGSFYSSANDMAQYMIFILNNGIVGKDTLVSREVFNEILKPQFHFPFRDEPIHNEFTSYGFGWWLTPKNGNKIIEHSGGVDGASAFLIMVKNKNFGVIVLINTSAGWRIMLSLAFDIIGNILNDPDYKKVSDIYKRNPVKDDSLQAELRDNILESRIRNTNPSLSLDQYEGIYNDEMYGDIYISKKDEKLQIEFSHTPLFTGDLSHWHYDTFEIDWEDPRIPNGFITFNFNSKEKVIGFKFDQPNLLDVDFLELEIKMKEDMTIDKEH